jgi:hypothetical protein
MMITENNKEENKMTEGQCALAVSLSNTISKLRELKKLIEQTHCRLRYATASKVIEGGYRDGVYDIVINDDIQHYIDKIFSRHDEQIRKELDEEIERIKEEIKKI